MSKVIANVISMGDLAHVLSHDVNIPLSQNHMLTMIKRGELPKPLKYGRRNVWKKTDLAGIVSVEEINKVLVFLEK